MSIAVGDGVAAGAARTRIHADVASTLATIPIPIHVLRITVFPLRCE